MGSDLELWFEVATIEKGNGWTTAGSDSHMAFDVFFSRRAKSYVMWAICGHFMLGKEDRCHMGRKDKTVAACSHVICFFSFFFWFMLFFSENLRHQVQKSSKIYIVLCHQFSAVFCDAPTEPRTSVSSIKGPPSKRKLQLSKPKAPKLMQEDMKTWKPRHLPAQYVVSQCHFLYIPPPSNHQPITFDIFLWDFFWKKIFPFKVFQTNQVTNKPDSCTIQLRTCPPGPRIAMMMARST